MLDVRGVDVVDEGDEVVVGHPIPRGQEVEVDELSWGPQKPLGHVQLTT